ncbi:hypothetical protein HYC85_028295 [Camellia sinensis]|uniref:Uncharacterized protein n=1 Tax=Camellia sinensis TaxID=4442 RepID=A0A7J7FYS7_CAMSI|nr:hypothetical protein HYC85_028295 [Camellia sinensis]
MRPIRACLLQILKCNIRKLSLYLPLIFGRRFVFATLSELRSDFYPHFFISCSSVGSVRAICKDAKAVCAVAFTSNFGWTERIVNEVQASPSISQKQRHISKREESVKEKQRHIPQNPPDLTQTLVGAQEEDLPP